jgi:hypothetical protein
VNGQRAQLQGRTPILFFPHLIEAGRADTMPDQEQSTSLMNMAVLLHTRFNQTGNKEDLNDAIELDREALALLPAGNPGL